jgi:hypothetical protein
MLGMASKVAEHIDHARAGHVDARRLGVALALAARRVEARDSAQRVRAWPSWPAGKGLPRLPSARRRGSRPTTTRTIVAAAVSEYANESSPTDCSFSSDSIVSGASSERRQPAGFVEERQRPSLGAHRARLSLAVSRWLRIHPHITVVMRIGRW